MDAANGEVKISDEPLEGSQNPETISRNGKKKNRRKERSRKEKSLAPHVEVVEDAINTSFVPSIDAEVESLQNSHGIVAMDGANSEEMKISDEPLEGSKISGTVCLTGKKKTRRGQRSRKDKFQPPHLEAVDDDVTNAPIVPSIVAEIESLTLTSHPISIAKQAANSNLSEIENDKETINCPKSNSPRKKKKKGKNVAIASIEKLGQIYSISNENLSSEGRSSHHIKKGQISSSSASLSRKECRKNVLDGLAGQRMLAEPSSPKCNGDMATSWQGESQHVGLQKRLNHQKSPEKKKKANFHPQGNNRKINEAFLNENKFEEYIQREHVEVMLQELPSSFVKGFIRINQRNYREAYITNPDGSKDILIDGVKDRNRALEGDEVVVLILPETSWKYHEGAVQKVGRVVHILSPVHHRQAVGTLKKMKDGNSKVALFSPRDSRVPRMQIPIKECPKDYKIWESCVFHGRITEWNDVRYAKGHLMGDVIGIQGDIEAETRAILLENDIDGSPYDQRLHVYFPSSPFKLSEAEFKGREDLRKLCIFTIDPSTAKDLDDAVSCEKLDNGNYKVGVHISDVSYFLEEGTPLDLEVAKRATTTYLVQRAYHMLPREMTMMCSLLPGEDKLAFSVFWEMTPEAEILSHSFTRSVIYSCAQLSYEHAQIMIDDPNHVWKEGELPKIHGGWSVEDLEQVVLSLQSLAAIMRKRRFESGALRVDQTKLTFSLTEAGEPESFAAYINTESHRLIEEFMLLANMTVATDLQKRFPSLAFLRCHDEPQPDMLQRLSDLLEKFGIILDTSSAGSLHKSLMYYRSESDPSRFIALNSLCSKPMVRARYFCAATMEKVEFMKHYALNAPLYTHFTSPIRRYADVMVHRLLSAMLNYSEEPKWSIDFVNRVAANCNKMKFCAKKAGEQSTELFLALWVKNKGVVEEEAVVIDVKDHSFDAVVCSMGINIRVYTDKLAAAVEYDNLLVPELKISWAVSRERSLMKPAYQVVTLFSVVKVALRTSNTNLLKLEASLLPPVL